MFDADRVLFDPQLNLSQLTEKQLCAMVELYKALGGGKN